MARVAQLAELAHCRRMVVGSIPATGSAAWCGDDLDSCEKLRNGPRRGYGADDGVCVQSGIE